jgi:DNA repair protein RadC
MSKVDFFIPEIKISVSFDRRKTELHSIQSTQDAFLVFQKIFNADTIDWNEEFILLCLNNANKVLGYYKISSGGMLATVVDLRMLFMTALNALSTQIIIAHNHPSGNLNPSNSDIALTKKIKEAGDFLDIKLLDHIIISDGEYYSFLENNLL